MWDPHNKGFKIWLSILRSPYLRKLPHRVQLSRACVKDLGAEGKGFKVQSEKSLGLWFEGQGPMVKGLGCEGYGLGLELSGLQVED